MFGLIIVIFCQLFGVSLDDYCLALGGDYCEGELLCMWNGASCQADNNAEVSATSITCSGAGCIATSRNILGNTYYFSYTASRHVDLINDCSIYYTYTVDAGTAVCPATTCGIRNFGVDEYSQSIDGCFDFCWAYPDDLSCSSQPCTSTGSVCCAVRTTNACTSYCTGGGTQSSCCGSPSNYTSVSTDACGNWSSTSSKQADYIVCMMDPTNLTACAMCSTYYTCCTQYKTVTGSALICDHFCGLKSSDAECKKRKECLEALGHVPTDEELTTCGTSVVRLSSFCVAVLLGLIGFFILGQ